jgi:acyl carrier protein
MVDAVSDTELYERIRLVLKQVVPRGVSTDDVAPQTRLLEDLNLESLRLMDLALSLEEAFGISIEDGVIETVTSVSDLLALVKEKVA